MLYLVTDEQPKPDFIQESLIYDSPQREDIYCIWSYFYPLLFFLFFFWPFTLANYCVQS